MSDPQNSSTTPDRAAQPRLHVRRDDRAGYALLTLSGQFVASTVLTVEPHLARVLNTLRPYVVVQLGELTEFDRSAGAVLNAAAHVASQRGGFLGVAAPPPVAWTVLCDNAYRWSVPVYASIADVLEGKPADYHTHGSPRPMIE